MGTPGENVHSVFGWDCLLLYFFQSVGDNFIISIFDYLLGWNGEERFAKSYWEPPVKMLP